MNKYYTINDRLQLLERWKKLSKALSNDEEEITLDEELHIKNDISDFIEKIRIVDGEMTILKDQKGTFGFPFKTVVDKTIWFTKLMIYDLDLDEKLINMIENTSYDEMTSEDKLHFHKAVLQQKNISVNTEYTVNTILTRLVLNKVTPHICLLYGETTMLEDKHKEIIGIFVEKYKKKDKDILLDMAKVLMMEWANLGDLSDYIQENYKKWTFEIWRALFFQMLAMLATIQEHYPTFRHNDLSLANILVQSTRKENFNSKEQPGYYKYHINGKEYCVPDIGFRILLTDFDYASIKEKNISNEKVNTEYTRKFGVVADQNTSFDCHMMFNWLIVWTLKLYKYEDNITGILGEVQKFLYGLIEEKYRGLMNRNLKHTRLRNGKRVVERFIPKNVLETNSIFEKYRNHTEWTNNCVFIEEYNKSSSHLDDCEEVLSFPASSLAKPQDLKGKAD